MKHSLAFRWSSIEREPQTWRSVWRPAALISALLIWTVVFTSTIGAQQRRSQPNQDPPVAPTSLPAQDEQARANIFTDPDKDYRISPGDVIQIMIEDASELSHNYVVSAAGDIEMSVLGRTMVRGKTTYELAKLIADGLRLQEYLKNPNVVVTVRAYNSRAFFIQGAVLKPGHYQLEGRPSLLTLIGLAGGLADNHGSTAFILRPNKTRKQVLDAQEQDLRASAQPQADQTASTLRSGGEKPEVHDSDSEDKADYELIKVNLSALYKGQFDQNRRLEPGDTINIPRADLFFVAGEVKAPGSFPLKEGTTLRQAISLAQGMTFKAKPSSGVIFREDPLTRSRREIKVDISDVMNGKKEDIPVQANDVIIVPSSQAKSITGALLMTFGFGSVRFPFIY
jgi:polysaccharide export outer membrane protein